MQTAEGSFVLKTFNQFGKPHFQIQFSYILKPVSTIPSTSMEAEVHQWGKKQFVEIGFCEKKPL